MWIIFISCCATLSAFFGAVVAHAVVHASTTPEVSGMLDSAAFWWLGCPIVVLSTGLLADVTARFAQAHRRASGLDRHVGGARLALNLCWLWPIVTMEASYFLAMHWRSTGRIDDWWVLGAMFMALYAWPASIFVKWWALRRSR